MINNRIDLISSGKTSEITHQNKTTNFEQRNMLEKELIVTLSLKAHPEKRFLSKEFMNEYNIKEGQEVEVTGPNGTKLKIKVYSEPKSNSVVSIDNNHIRLLYEDRKKLGVVVEEGYKNDFDMSSAPKTQKVTITIHSNS